MGLLDFFRRRRQPRQRDRVMITEEAITRCLADGTQETVRWDDLQEVGFITTDEGPFQEDVYYVFTAMVGRSGCAVPQGADGADKFFGWFERKLPGFNYEEAIKAMGSTSNAKFTCWQRLDA